MNEIYTSITVSIIAISVIFLVLTVLIFTIKLLVHFVPYVAPPKPAPKPQTAAPATATEEDEHIPAIVAAMASYLSQSPEKVQVVSIQPR